MIRKIIDFIRSLLSDVGVYFVGSTDKLPEPLSKEDEIKYVDWQFKLKGIGEVAEGVEDINQCIALILNTPKGTDPHRPTFGSNILKYIDYPVNIAKANIIRETIDAISMWETRVQVNSVLFNVEESNIKIKVQWTLNGSSTKGTTEVTL